MIRLARLWGSLVAFGLGSSLSLPAAAQYGPPPRQEAPPAPANNQASQATQPPARASRADVLRAAACVAGRDAEAADALLATAPFSGDERERATRLIRSAQRCLRSDNPVATSAMTFRGAIAETLYETRFPQSAAARSPAAGAAPFFQAANVSGQENAALITSHFQVAQCAAPAQPDLVRALLATDPGTPGERTALEALYPAFGACVPAGTQLSLDPGAIRGMLAEGLYRWSVVQRDGPTSAWAAPATPAPANPGG
jgi:hypothetical protein